jgi:DNA replication initiation complex subunit (GINS family)
MTEDSVAITYETLYEILRSEKNKEELCELDEIFYANVLEYLKEKTRILEEASSKSDIFSLDEKDNTQVQLRNIRKIIREIYERREKKIINMALNKSRTNSDIIDTSNLLNPEQKFFQTLTGLFDKFRFGILAQILSLQEPDLSIECAMELPEEAEPDFTPKEIKPEVKETKEEITTPEPETKQEPLPVETSTEPKPTEETPVEPEKPLESKSVKKIKIIQPVEQLVGSELEIYGPYKEKDIAEVPSEIAEILIGKGSAVEVE